MATALRRLHRAAQSGEEGRIRQYLNAGDLVDARDSNGNTALLWAIVRNHFNCVKLLLSAGADPSVSDNEQYFPLYLAAQHGNIAIAKALIGANADIYTFIDRTNSGTALFMAASKGDRAMVKLLLDEGCDTSKKSADGRHPLTAASFKMHTEVVSLLLDAGADVNAVCGNGLTALLAATQAGSCDIVKILLDRGANINEQREDGSVALHLAASQGFDEVVDVLILAGADVDQPNKTGSTPLHSVSYSGHPKCAWALLRAGANVSARDNEGGTPLHAAAFKGHTDVIEILLSAGGQADVNLEDNTYHTPLTFASRFADAKAVNLLLDAGADVNRQNAHGGTALFAVENVNNAKVLLDRGANAKMLSNRGETVLHFAGLHGACAGVICALYRGGADPTVVSLSEKTAADYAREEGHEDAAKLLDLLAAKHRAMNNA